MNRFRQWNTGQGNKEDWCDSDTYRFKFFHDEDWYDSDLDWIDSVQVEKFYDTI